MLTTTRKTTEIAELDPEAQATLEFEDDDWSDEGLCCVEPEAGKEVLKALFADAESGEPPNEEKLQFFFDIHRPHCRYCQEVPIERIQGEQVGVDP